MKTTKQCEEEYNTGKLLKATLHGETVYYAEREDAYKWKAVSEVNDLSIALSEWWEVYHNRLDDLQYVVGKENIVPVITENECIAWGL
jgi:hypothetical protein